jgi:hypothetical protein
MRQLPSKDRAESRVVSKYHKAYTHLIELIQALQDLAPQGMQINDTVELIQEKGSILIDYKPKPISIVIRDGKRVVTVQLKEGRNA